MNENQEKRGRQASVDGFAHEHIVVGILMKKYQNVSLVDLPLSTYDIIIVRTDEEMKEDILRAQVKTARTTVSFTGGTRGGVDRTYISDVKTYLQSPETSDVIVGIRPLSNDSYDLYFIPTILIEIWDTKSKSLNKIAFLKNNYDMLEKCKCHEYVIEQAKAAGIIS